MANGHFQPPQWPTSVDPGGHWLGLDVSSTDTADGVTGNAMGARRERWYARKVSVCYITLCFGSPTPAPTLRLSLYHTLVVYDRLP